MLKRKYRLFILFIITFIISATVSFNLFSLVIENPYTPLLTQLGEKPLLTWKDKRAWLSNGQKDTSVLKQKWLLSTLNANPFLTVAVDARFNELEKELNILSTHLKTNCLQNTPCPPEFQKTYAQTTGAALYLITGLMINDPIVLSMLEPKGPTLLPNTWQVFASLKKAGQYPDAPTLSQGLSLFENTLNSTKKLFHWGVNQASLPSDYQLYAIYIRLFNKVYQEKENLGQSSKVQAH